MPMTSTNALLRRVVGCLALMAIISPTCLAFIPQAQPQLSTQQQPQHGLTLSMSTTLFQPTQSSLDKLDSLKLSIKKPRGASIGVEYTRLNNNNLSDGDLKILSMQLRRAAKAAAIWSSDVQSIAKLVKEQESARGEFPGPLPVIYSGPLVDASVVKTVVDGGVTAVVADYGQSLEEAVTLLLGDVGVIWKVSSLDEMQKLQSETDVGNVILLSNQVIPASVDDDDDASDELAEYLSNNKSKIVTIAQIQSMMPANAEIQLGKHLAKLGISSLVLDDACVGDEEDLKYTAYAIEELQKKSSSQFSMTGLTGSTNGHFGVSSHGGEVKWRRNAE